MNQIRVSFFAVFASFVLAFSGTAFAQGQKVSLRPKWIAGKKYVMSQDIESITKIPIPNKEGDQKMNMKMGMEMVVKQVKPNEKTVSMSFTGMKMNMDMAGQKMEIDAADPAQKEAMGGLLEMKPVFVYTNEDEFVRIEGMEGLDAGPMGKAMTPGMLKQMINGALETMPQEPVAVGHKWEQKIEIPMEGTGKIKVMVKYHFEKMEVLDSVNCAVISFAGDLGGEIIAPLQGIEMTIEEGLFTGKIHFDPEIGYPRKQESRNRFVMNMMIPGQGKEMVIPMDQKLLVKLTSFGDAK